jgi:hypothetical protein
MAVIAEATWRTQEALFEDILKDEQGDVLIYRPQWSAPKVLLRDFDTYPCAVGDFGPNTLRVMLNDDETFLARYADFLIDP